MCCICIRSIHVFFLQEKTHRGRPPRGLGGAASQGAWGAGAPAPPRATAAAAAVRPGGGERRGAVWGWGWGLGVGHIRIL